MRDLCFRLRCLLWRIRRHLVGMCRSLGVRRRSRLRLRRMEGVHQRVVCGVDAREAVDGRVYCGGGEGEGDIGSRLQAAEVVHHVRPATVSTAPLCIESQGVYRGCVVHNASWPLNTKMAV